jgi:uroporphyrinogen-III decarboxylase
MTKPWNEMAPEEKREERFKKWLNTDGIKFNSLEAAQQYHLRAQRLKAAILNQEPDRVPVSLPVGNFPAYYIGLNLKAMMYDYDALLKAWLKFMEDFKDDMDTVSGPGLTHPGRAMDRLENKLFKWPGHGLGDNVNAYQFVEGEYMKASEYRAFLDDPTDYMLRVCVPRHLGATQGLQKMAPLTSAYGRTMTIVNSFTRPEVREAFQVLIDAGIEMEKWGKYIYQYNQATTAAGFAHFRGGMGTAPFDIFADSMRGTQGAILDMYRNPDLMLEAINKITPIMIKHIINSVNAANGFLVTFPLHKGDDVFMSDKQFEKFYWPTLKQTILALREEGIMSSLFAEGKFQRRLDAISELPKGWTVWQFDQTDMALAKKKIGHVSCIMGNVPASVMCTGSTETVTEYCKKLIEDCAPGGGYILTGGAQATESNPANFRAMMAAAKKWGTYRE